jgi:hypothetical protein
MPHLLRSKTRGLGDRLHKEHSPSRPVDFWTWSITARHIHSRRGNRQTRKEAVPLSFQLEHDESSWCWRQIEPRWATDPNRWITDIASIWASRLEGTEVTRQGVLQHYSRSWRLRARGDYCSQGDVYSLQATVPLCSADRRDITLFWLNNPINRSEAFVRSCFLQGTCLQTVIQEQLRRNYRPIF